MLGKNFPEGATVSNEILYSSQGLADKELEQHEASFPSAIHSFCQWITLTKPKWKLEVKDQTDVIPERYPECESGTEVQREGMGE